MNNPFGVLEFLHWNHDWNHYKYPSDAELEKVAKLMKEAGVGWVRVDFLWQDIEPKEGAFDFAKYDRIVDIFSDNNINILGLFNYSADWATLDGGWNSPPKDNKLFVAYTSEVIKRYKDKVKYWEVWNEPDSSVYWSVQDGLKSYVSLLKDVYTAAKKIDPDCKVLNGGLAKGISSINCLYDKGAKGYFDILNLHFFENPLHEGSIKAVASFPRLAYKIMSRNGDCHKKIWITEIGCPGVRRGLAVNKWWLGKNPTEKQQASWLKKVYTELLKDENVEKAFWAFFRDTKEHWDNGVDYFGIIRWNYSKKPAFNAYRDSFNAWKKKTFGAGGGT
ncbi:MAG: family 1 glycosylhydrolase [Candidatus Omnitrophota bacterium]